MISKQRTKSKASERGVALIVALLTLLLISALLMGMIVASNSETEYQYEFSRRANGFLCRQSRH